MESNMSIKSSDNMLLLSRLFRNSKSNHSLALCSSLPMDHPFRTYAKFPENLNVSFSKNFAYILSG